MRIVSLLPSATEIVYALGLGNDLVGVSHECDFPSDAERKPKIIEPIFKSEQLDSQRIDDLVREYSKRRERLYRINMDELRKANPDLIITQELCDVCAIGAEDVLSAVNKLAKPVNVLSLNPHSLNDVKDDVRNVGSAVGRPEYAARVIAELERRAEEVKKLTEDAGKPRVFCVEWLKPLMNAGHWIPAMVEYAGGTEGLANRGKSSTYIDWTSAVKYDPEIIILMPCGFTTRRTMEEAKDFFDLKDTGQVAALRNGRVFATDGHNYFSRSGPRLFDGIRILAQIIHPELFSESLDPQFGMRVEIAEAKL